ncbi:hypothetical protein JL721_13065 [Aureococcus anophagefferens]|nr:hypothetical protein JL721_13065 [Aureococcus anophagefferens]
MGATSVGVPVYVTELEPAGPAAARRPFNVFISTGILLAFALAYGGADGGWWRCAALGCAGARRRLHRRRPVPVAALAQAQAGLTQARARLPLPYGDLKASAKLVDGAVAAAPGERSQGASGPAPSSPASASPSASSRRATTLIQAYMDLVGALGHGRGVIQALARPLLLARPPAGAALAAMAASANGALLRSSPRDCSSPP